MLERLKNPLKLRSSRWKAFTGDDKGIIIVMFALMLPLMVGFIGLGVEVAQWFGEKRNMQAAADAAAIAGAYEVNESRASQTKTIAQREAENNGWDSTSGTITVRNTQFDPTDPVSNSYTTDYTTDASAVEVVLTWTLTPMFIGYFISGDVTINARAVATIVTGSTTACILALGDPSSPGGNDPADAVKVAGSATVTMSGCNVATNSTDDKAVNVDSGLTVDCIYSAGGIDGTANTTECASPGKTNQQTTSDPYDTAPPTKPVATDFDNCDSAGDTSSSDGANYKKPGGSGPAGPPYNLSPGVYCDIEFGVNGETLTLAAGTYYIDRGDFDVKGGGIINGTAGVTIVLGDSTWDGIAGNANCGAFKVAGASFVDLTAPVTADNQPFTGLAIYRNSDCDKGEKIEFTGTTTSTILGAVYNPAHEIKVTGTGALNGTCLQIIGNTIEFTGDSGIGSSCANVDVQTVSTGDKISLVE